MLLEIKKILTALFLFSPLLVSGGGGALPRDNHSLSLFLFFLLLHSCTQQKQDQSHINHVAGQEGQE